MLETLITFALTVSTLFTAILLCLPKQYHAEATPISDKTDQQPSSKRHATSVQVVVLGDLGRSPRMQYHALSIAKHGGYVQLIGYLETEPIAELRARPNVTIISIPPAPRFLQTSSKVLFLAFAPLKVLHQVWSLWWVLAYKAAPSQWLLLQNPPSIPTLLIASVVCFLRHTRLVIDWHNFGHSILALRLGRNHPFVRLSEVYEKALAQVAYAHFAVTNVMTSLLQAEYVSRAPVMTLHDRPAALFQPVSLPRRRDFLAVNSLTSQHADEILAGNTRLVVSSTSWTPDEDFGVLLEALCQYSALGASSPTPLPTLLVIITGKGPQQALYKEKIKYLKQKGQMQLVSIETAWLSFEDYALLLGSADLGVSLHTSSSGVDLPMKVVDMFGTGLPVLGFNNFKAWPELVSEGVNGKGFATANQMAAIMQELFCPGGHQLDTLKHGAVRESSRRWDAEWDPVAGTLFDLTSSTHRS